MTEPLRLPEDFNPKSNLIAKKTENGIFHESRQGARFAENLIANGTPVDLELAKKVLDATLACQEVLPNDPHYGNFYWMAEDDVVMDLNAVQFNLEHLIPIMLRYRERLEPDMQERVLTAIRLGLDEIRNLDVHVGYSNITMLDIHNTCLGGELLNDQSIAQRGYNKLIKWITFTDASGIPREYNSPTYTPVIIRALKRLVDLTSHEPTRIRAKTFAARIALSSMLHIHRATGRWAGPHSRAYQPSVVGERPPELNMIKEWLEDGHLPSWAAELLTHPEEPYFVNETASSFENLGLTTYQSENFALGVASKEYGGQSDVLMAHFVREGAERPGVMYTRYVMDDKWLGDFYHATDRTTSRNLIEEGRFFGVQNGAKAIGLYAPTNMSHCRSAKATFIFTDIQKVDEIWINGDKTENLPVDVPENAIVVVASGNALIAIQPIARHDAGRNAPIRLLDKSGDLVLELYNYLGAEKDFWEMQSSLNPFFKGHAYNAVYVEVAERTDYADGKAFTEHIRSGSISIEVAPAFTTDFFSERPIKVSYARDGQQLGLEVDLMAWELKRRWTQDGDLGWPMLDCPVATETRDGTVTIGDASLTCGDSAGWLYANPEKHLWVAGYHGPDAASLKLTIPDGSVELEAMGTGTIVWDNGQVTIEANDIQGTPIITGGQLK